MLSKERQAKKRANIKKDNEAYQTYLKKDRQRKAAQRSAARVGLTTAEGEEYHLKERPHIRDYRAKKKSQAHEGEESQPLMSTPYRSTRAIGKGEINQIKPQFDAKWEDVLAVPKTHTMHCIIPQGKVMVMVSDTSDSKEYTIVPLWKPDSPDSEEEAVTPLDKS